MKITIPLTKQHDCTIDIRPSGRAKYLRLKIDREGQVQVVLPKHYSVQQAEAFAVSKKAWIAKTLQSIQQHPVEPLCLPHQLTLPLVNETWHIHYQKTDESCLRYSWDNANCQIQFTGMVDNEPLVFECLDIWLKATGKRCLPELLEQVSSETGLDYNRVTIRKQKTRWGSCSSRKSINLNCKLLFFPERVVRYVMVHELCHTLEMNHSTRFWSLVEKHDPEYRSHEVILKQSHRYVPRGI